MLKSSGGALTNINRDLVLLIAVVLCFDYLLRQILHFVCRYGGENLNNDMDMAEFDFVRDDILRRVMAYWIGIRDGKRVPQRSRLDPVEIPFALSKIWLMRRDRVTGEFIYILAGEDIQNIYQKSLAGKALDEVFAKSLASKLRQKFTQVCDTPSIVCDIGPVYTYTDKPGHGERLMLPLADEQGWNAFLLGCTVYDWRGVIRPAAATDVTYETIYTVL